MDCMIDRIEKKNQNEHIVQTNNYEIQNKLEKSTSK